MTNEEWQTLNDLHQDTIQSLSADLETGSHHMNNRASERFNREYPHLCLSMRAMGEWIEKMEPPNEVRETSDQAGHHS